MDFRITARRYDMTESPNEIDEMTARPSDVTERPSGRSHVAGQR